MHLVDLTAEHENQIQLSSPCNPDTNGAEESVHISKVAIFQGFKLHVLVGK